MMKQLVGDMLTPEVIGVSPTTPVGEAISLMGSRRISCLPVLVDDKPVGIFTERSIVRYMARRGAALAARSMLEVMTAPVITATRDMFLYEAFHILTNNRIRHLVIVDDAGRAEGLLTFTNVINRIPRETFAEMGSVSRLMKKVLFTIQAGIPVRDILTEMAERGISCVIVTENERPIGMLSERDVAGLVIEGRDLDRTTVREAMRSPVITVQPDLPMLEAVALMRGEGIRRVVVAHPDGRIAGLLTQSDIVKGLETRYVHILKQVIEEKDTRLQTATRHLDETSATLENILASALDMGIVATDVDLHVTYFNPAAERLLGYPAQAAVGRDAREFLGGEGVDAARLEQALDVAREKANLSFTCEREVEGERRVLQGRLSAVRDRQERLVGFVMLLQDVTERRKAEENMRFMAFHDILTGLPNRVSLMERLQLELARAARNTTRLAVMMLDLDRFKEINDSLGHYAGDLLLQGVAERLKGRLRKSDTVARVGGDEFVVLAPDLASREQAAQVADKLREALDCPFEIKDQSVRAAVSLGVAIYPDHGDSAKALLEAADAAMYRAKDVGRSNGCSNCAEAEGSCPG